MNTEPGQEEELQRTEARIRKFQEVEQAKQSLFALVANGMAVYPELLQFFGKPPFRRFELEEVGRMEIRQTSRMLPGPLAYWQGESTLHILLWQRAITLVLRKRTAL